MDSRHIDRIRRIFQRASALQGVSRWNLLERECGDDDFLRAQVECLLQSNSGVASLFQTEEPFH
jgi:hypothetical protein